jgi:hypothetical protein
MGRGRRGQAWGLGEGREAVCPCPTVGSGQRTLNRNMRSIVQADRGEHSVNAKAVGQKRTEELLFGIKSERRGRCCLSSL